MYVISSGTCFITESLQGLFDNRPVFNAGRIAGIHAPRTPFRTVRRDHIFLFNAKRKIWEKESAPPDTMLDPAQLLHSLKRVVGCA